MIMKKLENGLLATLIPLVNPSLHLGLPHTRENNPCFNIFNRFKLTEENFPCYFVYDSTNSRIGLVTNDNYFIQDKWLFRSMVKMITELYELLEKSYVIKDEETRKKGTKFLLKALKKD